MIKGINVIKQEEKDKDNKIFEEIKLTDDVSSKKEKLQSYAKELSKEHPHLVLSWATGCGKSLAALMIIKSKIDSGDTTPWFIVCSELNHIDNWIKEIVKHKLSYLMDYIEIFCYASLKKYRGRKANLILDESHSVSDLRLDILKTIKPDQVVSLSATLNEERKLTLSQISEFREFNVTITDAINLGILPAPQIIVIYDELDNKVRSYTYIKTKGKISKKIHSPILGATYDNYIEVMSKNKDLNSYTLNIKCTAKEYYDILTSDIEYHKSMIKNNEWSKLKMLRKGTERKEFVANTKTPLLTTLTSCLINNHIRFIGFTGSIEQCDIMSGNNRIHSKISAKEIKSRIEKFNKKEINRLFAVQMLREGQNFEDIEAGIITQLDSESLSFVQMMGRVFRSTNPILFVLIKDKTQDVVYLKNCIDGLDDKYITYIENTPNNLKFINDKLCQRKSKDQEKTLDRETLSKILRTERF